MIPARTKITVRVARKPPQNWNGSHIKPARNRIPCTICTGNTFPQQESLNESKLAVKSKAAKPFWNSCLIYFSPKCSTIPLRLAVYLILAIL